MEKPDFKPLLDLLDNFAKIEPDPTEFVSHKALMIIDGLIDLMGLLTVPLPVANGIKDVPIQHLINVRNDVDKFKNGAMTAQMVHNRFQVECQRSYDYFSYLDNHWNESALPKNAEDYFYNG